jgi:hypothetical protein
MNPSPLVCVVVSGELDFTFAKSNTVCVSVVNNKVCVVVMLQIQVMYIIFQYYSKTLRITNVNNYSDEITFWDKQFI